jgi:hypothetical protein
MAKIAITPEGEKFILTNYLKFPSRDLANKLAVSKTAVLNCLKRNNLNVPPELIKEWRKRKLISKPYTDAEKQYIIENISTQSIKQLASNLKRCNAKIRPMISALGLDHIIEQKKLASRIQLGTIPANKGKKMHEYMNAEQIAIFKANQYKKGSIPHNALADGTEVKRFGKSGKIYTLIKVPGHRKLVLKHRHVWETFHNKKIPNRHKITFKDGDTSNFNIDNLECISYEDQMIQNSIHQYPEDLKEILHLKGAITRQINKTKKHDTRPEKQAK